MGYRVTGEVYRHSKYGGNKLHVLLAIAETAHNGDGVAFGLDQGWPREHEGKPDRKRETIAGKARMRPETVSRSIKELVRADELEVRSVQQGSERTYVYRVTLGIYRDLEADEARLERYAQRLDRPFSSPEELALPWSERPANSSGGNGENGASRPESSQPSDSAPGGMLRPEEIAGRPERDGLTSEPLEPEISSGDGLTSAPPYTRARVEGRSNDPVPNSSLTCSPSIEEEHVPSPPGGAGEPAEPSSSKELVRAFALKLGRWPKSRQEWGAWMKAFSPLADQGVTPDELGLACESYLAFHHKFGRDVDLSPFGLTKHWQVITQALEHRFFNWMRWAADISWRLPEDEVAWQLARAAERVQDGDFNEIAAMARRARAAHADAAAELMRWVETEGWSLADDDWRIELAARLPRAAATERRRAATHRRHELRRDLARLRAGLALPNEEAA